MLTGPDDVRLQGKTGSSRPTAKATRLIQLGHRTTLPERQPDRYDASLTPIGVHRDPRELLISITVPIGVGRR